MPRTSTLHRDDATGALLHRVGDRWLPLELALEAQEARDHACAAVRTAQLEAGCPEDQTSGQVSDHTPGGVSQEPAFRGEGPA